MTAFPAPLLDLRKLQILFIFDSGSSLRGQINIFGDKSVPIRRLNYLMEDNGCFNVAGCNIQAMGGTMYNDKLGDKHILLQSGYL